LPIGEDDPAGLVDRDSIVGVLERDAAGGSVGRSHRLEQRIERGRVDHVVQRSELVGDLERVQFGVRGIASTTAPESD